MIEPAGWVKACIVLSDDLYGRYGRSGQKPH